jgi:PDZ domain
MSISETLPVYRLDAVNNSAHSKHSIRSMASSQSNLNTDEEKKYETNTNDTNEIANTSLKCYEGQLQDSKHFSTFSLQDVEQGMADTDSNDRKDDDTTCLTRNESLENLVLFLHEKYNLSSDKDDGNDDYESSTSPIMVIPNISPNEIASSISLSKSLNTTPMTIENNDNEPQYETNVITTELQSDETFIDIQGHPLVSNSLDIPLKERIEKQQEHNDVGDVADADDNEGAVVAFHQESDSISQKMESTISILTSNNSTHDVVADENSRTRDDDDDDGDDTSSCQSNKTSLSAAAVAVFESVFASLSTKFPKYQQQQQHEPTNAITTGSFSGHHYVHNGIAIKDLQQNRTKWHDADNVTSSSSCSEEETGDKSCEDDVQTTVSIISSSNGSYYDKVWRFNDNETTCKIISVPSGKLGIAIDSTLIDGPIISKVYKDSPLNGKLCVGDRIIAINDINTRSMSSAALTSLIMNTVEMSSTRQRQFTLLRRVVNKTK